MFSNTQMITYPPKYTHAHTHALSPSLALCAFLVQCSIGLLSSLHLSLCIPQWPWWNSRRYICRNSSVQHSGSGVCVSLGVIWVFFGYGMGSGAVCCIGMVFFLLFWSCALISNPVQFPPLSLFHPQGGPELMWFLLYSVSHVCSQVFRHTRPYITHVPSFSDLYSFVAASDEHDLATISPEEVDRRIAERLTKETKVRLEAYRFPRCALIFRDVPVPKRVGIPGSGSGHCSTTMV